MARVRGNIDINGRKCWTLFDTGSRNTYIAREAVGSLPSWDIPTPEKVAIGGETYTIRRECTLMGKVEGYWVRTRARILEDIGYDEEGRRLEVIFGALAMEEWGIYPIPEEERLDLSHYPKEFVEYWAL
ncbi:MAG: hypothetical protein U9Q78_04215 [Chloroflexota bacterium]|nr:hypothetical protein [Chloroflexota bacterium]